MRRGATAIAISSLILCAPHPAAAAPTLPPVQKQEAPLPTLPPPDGINWDCTLDGRPDLRGLDVRQVGLAEDRSIGCTGLDAVLDLPDGVQWNATLRSEYGPLRQRLRGEQCRYQDLSGRQVVVLDTTDTGLGATVCGALQSGMELDPPFQWEAADGSTADLRVSVDSAQVLFTDSQSTAFGTRSLNGPERALTVRASVDFAGVPMLAIGCVRNPHLYLFAFTPPAGWAMIRWGQEDGWSTLLSGSTTQFRSPLELDMTCLVDHDGVPTFDLSMNGSRLASARSTDEDIGAGFDSVAVYGEGIEGESGSFSDLRVVRQWDN